MSLELWDNVAGILAINNLFGLDQKFRDIGMPAVGFSSGKSCCDNCVVLDFVSLIDMGIARLAEHGIDKFTFISFKLPKSLLKPGDTHLHVHDYIKKMSSKTSVDSIEVPYLPEGKEIFHLFGQLWDSSRRPECMFFLDDCLCGLFLPAILEKGIRVPEDLKILSHANVGKKFCFPIDIETVAFDPRAAAYEAWEMLSGLISRKKTSPSVSWRKPQIVPGESLG